MKKIDVVNLIKYHFERNELAFKDLSYELVKEFEVMGNEEIAKYLMEIMSTATDYNYKSTSNFSLAPQSFRVGLKYLYKMDSVSNDCILPDALKEDVLGIINAISRNIGVNKFLFKGKPGTGKTECVKQLSRILSRTLFSVNFSEVINSLMGQTQKNIDELFKEINSYPNLDNILIMFDEIDALAMDRTNSSDVREMGRATSTFLKALDELNQNAIIIATTNLYDHFDKALSRRFDYIIDFDKYGIKDLIDIADSYMSNFTSKGLGITKNKTLMDKILKEMDPIVSPGELINYIKSSVAFSCKDNEYDYLRRLFNALISDKNVEPKYLKEKGYSIRDIAILTGKTKSQIEREVKEG